MASKKPAADVSGALVAGGAGSAAGLTFDQRLARLEAIVAELEGGGIALEPAIERYQEGVELLKSCRSTLAGYRKRVEELSADAEASEDAPGRLAPYAADPDAGEGGS